MPDSGWVNPGWGQVVWTTDPNTFCTADHGPWMLNGYGSNPGGSPDTESAIGGFYQRGSSASSDPNANLPGKWASHQVLGVGLIDTYGSVNDLRTIGLQLSEFGMNLPAGTVEKVEFRIRSTDLYNLKQFDPVFFEKLQHAYLSMLRLETRERINNEGGFLIQYTPQSLPQNSAFFYFLDESIDSINGEARDSLPLLGYEDFVNSFGWARNFWGYLDFDDRLERKSEGFRKQNLGDLALSTSLFNGPTFALTLQVKSFVPGINTALDSSGWTHSGATALFDSLEIKVHYHEPGVQQLEGKPVSMRLAAGNAEPGLPHTVTDVFAKYVTETVEDGDITWPDLTGAIDEDESTYSSIATLHPGEKTNALRFRDFSEAVLAGVPSNATIDRIMFRTRRAGTSTSRKIEDDGVFIMFGDVATGEDKSKTGRVSFENYIFDERAPGQPFLRSDLLSPAFGLSIKTKAPATNTGDTYARYYYTYLNVFYEVFKAGTTGQWGTSGVIGTLLEMPAGDPVVGEFDTDPAVMGVALVLPEADVTSGAWGAPSPANLGTINGLPDADTSSGTWGTNTPILEKGIDRALEAVTSAQWSAAGAGMVYDNAALFGSVEGFWSAEPPDNAEPKITSSASSASFLQRFRNYLPPWYGDEGDHPIVDSVIFMASTVALGAFRVIREADFQVRLKTASGGWLDLWSYDFFQGGVPRMQDETDESFRGRIEREIFRDRNTRQALYDAMLDLTGYPPRIFEPMQPRDTGAYGGPFMAYNGVGYNGDEELVAAGEIGRYGEYVPHQGWIDVTLPDPVGIPIIGGYGVGPWGYDAAGGGAHGMWFSSEPPPGVVTSREIDAVLRRTKPEGVILWVRLV